MKTLLLTLVCLPLYFGNGIEPNWLTDFEIAKQEAAANNKYILMSFSGSDWCANCMRLEKDLFSTAEFADFAKENLVLLQLDFPVRQQNKLSAEQTAHNKALAEKYNRSGAFPTVLILDAEGKLVGKMKQSATTAEAYIASIQALIQ